jgi:hypothetical protein
MDRPTVPADIRALIREMANANPRWGAPRIHGELLKLGIDVCQATVAKYLVRGRWPPSQTWRTFLRNHVGQIVAADFFVVPTATYRLLFALVLLAHDRRRIRHVAPGGHARRDVCGPPRHAHIDAHHHPDDVRDEISIGQPKATARRRARRSDRGAGCADRLSDRLFGRDT